MSRARAAGLRAPLRLPALRYWILLGALALALFLAPRLWGSRLVVERRAALHLQRAQAHLGARDFPRARAEFRAALRLQPDSAQARRQLAEMEQGLGNWELAFVELASLTEMHPDDAEAWIALARVMVQRGWLEAPEAALDRALEVAPQRSDAHALRAELRRRLGRLHGARVDAELAHTTLPPPSKPAPPRHLRGDAQIDVGSLAAWTREAWPGRLGQARRELQAALDKKDWPQAQRIVDAAEAESVFKPYLAGVLALARGDADAAERHLDDALAVAPRNPTVIAALARTWALQKSAAYAGDQLMRKAERDPSFAFARYLAARAYVEARDPTHAEAALRRGLALQPDSPVPYQHLADYYFGLDRSTEALDICGQGLDRFPQDLALRMMQAQIDASVGRTADAERAYETVLEARPDLDIVEYRLASLDGESERGRLLRDLGPDEPSDPLLMDVLGWLQFRAGDPKRAQALLEAAVKSLPLEPRPHFHLASVYARENKPDLARTELEAALGSGRPFAERLEALRLMRESVSPTAGK